MLALSSTSYDVSQQSGVPTSVSVTIDRNGDATDAASVTYATSNGTAVAGRDYTAASGTVSWAAGDGSSKSFKVSILGSSSFSGTKSFTVGLSSAAGGVSLGASNATVTITGAATSTALGVKVKGNILVNGAGTQIQLRGVNVASMETAYTMQYSSTDPWIGADHNWSQIASKSGATGAWYMNAVRIPLNETSWNANDDSSVTCLNDAGSSIKPDPAGNYRTTLDAAVSGATAAGLYVILDLHWSAPGKYCAQSQQGMPDADHSVAFWQSVAARYKGYPNVIFDLYNEPFVFPSANGDGMFDLTASGTVDDTGVDQVYNRCIMNGCQASYFYRSQMSNKTAYKWTAVGLQSLINTIRATGATNVIMVSNNHYTSYLGSVWGTAWQPDDSAAPAGYSGTWTPQLAAAWHYYYWSYPYGDGNGGGLDQASTRTALDQVRAQVPIIIGEYGEDNDAAGSSADQAWFSQLFDYANASGHKDSYFAWGWNVNSGWPPNIADDSGNYTDYGQPIYTNTNACGSRLTCP
jgi:hypothetical protein